MYLEKFRLDKKTAVITGGSRGIGKAIAIAFAEAGADYIVIYLDSTNDPDGAIEMIREKKLKAGVSLAVEHPVSMVAPYLAKLDLVVVIGTGVGEKGIKTVADGTYEKIRELAKLRTELGLGFEIEADGAIRRETVPLLRKAGADIVVPGSLIFKNDMKEISNWLHSL